MNKKYKINFYPPPSEIAEKCVIYIKPEEGAIKYLCCDSQGALHTGKFTQSLAGFEIDETRDLQYFRHFQKAILRAIVKQNSSFLDDPVKFFIFPFATSGDRVAVPDDPPINNSMSYENGFTPPYQGDWPTDVTAIPIPRTQTNQYLYDITNAIQQYQKEGFPDFITSADNGGSPFPYDIYAIVRHDPGSGIQIYQSLDTNNTDTPPSSKWQNISVINQEICCAAYLNSVHTLTVAGGYQLVPFDTVDTNFNGAAWFDDSDSSINPTLPGLYLIHATVKIIAETGNHPPGEGFMSVFRNGGILPYQVIDQKPTGTIAAVTGIDYNSSPYFQGSTIIFSSTGTDKFQIFIEPLWNDITIGELTNGQKDYRFFVTYMGKNAMTL